MYLGYEQVSAGAAVQTASALTIPAKATHAELQAEVQNVRYTMDNSTAPTTSSGMILRTTDEPKQFVIDDLRRIKFIRDGASDATLNIHYFGGRDI